MKKILLAILVIVLLVGAGFFFSFMKDLQTKTSLDHSVVLEIPKGSSVQQIADQLKVANVISSTWSFRLYAYITGKYKHFPSGKFRFEPNITTSGVVFELTNTARQEVSVTLLEGWTIQQMDDYLSKDVGLFQPGAFAAAATVTDSRTILPNETYEFLRSKPINVDLEGYLFPDTYRLFLDGTPTDLIKKMLDNFGIHLTTALQQGIQKQGLTIHQAVTMASLLEKEARTPEDKKVVAGILFKRMSLGMPLQLDTTVIYATGTAGANLTTADLQTDSPYNTYVHTGLPIGAIGNPGATSLQAVANAIESNYVYFITDPAGKVYYSTTYEEHLTKKHQLYP